MHGHKNLKNINCVVTDYLFIYLFIYSLFFIELTTKRKMY
jgi:hypothetical protein